MGVYLLNSSEHPVIRVLLVGRPTGLDGLPRALDVEVNMCPVLIMYLNQIKSTQWFKGGCK